MPQILSDRPGRHSNRFLGQNDANNGVSTIAVVGNPDGSLVERLEYLQTQQIFDIIQNAGLIASGQVFWVSNVTGGGGADTVNNGSWAAPYATLAFALTKVTASRGDVIAIKEGHAETVSSATALLLNVAGVNIVGMGQGTLRPKFTLDTANTATIAVSADNVALVNLQVVANFLSIAAAFTLSTAKGFYASRIEFRDTSSVLNFLNCFKSTGAANTIDGFRADSCEWLGLGTTSVNSFLLSANDIDKLRLTNNYVKLARTATAAILATITAGVLTAMRVKGNTCISQQTAETGGGLINVGGTTSTGAVEDNRLATLTTATDIMVTTNTGVVFFNNTKTGVLAASGFLLPAADS